MHQCIIANWLNNTIYAGSNKTCLCSSSHLRTSLPRVFRLKNTTVSVLGFIGFVRGIFEVGTVVFLELHRIPNRIEDEWLYLKLDELTFGVFEDEYDLALAIMVAIEAFTNQNNYEVERFVFN